MPEDQNEEAQLRSVALQTTKSILAAREKAERELLKAKAALEVKTGELAVSLSMMQATLEAATDAILVVDAEGRVTNCNRKYAALWRIPPEIMQTQEHQKLLEVCSRHFHDPWQFLSRVKEIYDTSPPESFDLLMLIDGRMLERVSTIQYSGDRNIGRVWSFRNITARMRAEEETRQQQEWFRVTLQSIGDAVITTDIQGRVTFLNPIAETLTGWSSGEASGLPLEQIFKIIHEETRQPVINPIAKVLREGRIVGLANHTALLAKDGTETSIEDSAAPIRDSDGKISGAVMVFHDVSDKRRAEKILQSSHAIFSSMIDQSPVGIYLLDANLRLQHINPTALPVFGPIKDLIGNDWIEIIHRLWPSDIADDCVAQARHTLETGKPHVVRRFAGDRADTGVREYYDWELHRVLLPDGQYGIVAYFTDISQHVLAQQALRESEQKLRATFNQAAVGIAIANLSGQFEEVNDRFSSILRYSKPELLQLSFRSLTHDRDSPATEDNVRRLLAGEITDYVMEKRYVRKGGELVWCLVTVTLLKDEVGQPQRFLGVIEDITSKKKGEEASLRLSAIVESSDDAIISQTQEGIIISWNRGAERMFGYREEEVIGKPVSVLFPPEQFQEEQEVLARLKRGERTENYETRRIRKDGTALDVSLTVSVIKDMNDNITGVSKIARDITDRKRAENNQREETLILELLKKTGTQIAAKLELQTLVQTVTDAGCELSGAQFGAFFYNVINDAGETFMLYTLSGAPREAFEKFGMPRNTPIFNPTFQGEAAVRSGDITQDPRYGTMSPHHGMPKGHLPVRSYLAVPVISRSGQVIGGLFFGHPETHVFTERSERLIVGIASQAAIAIDNARLYEAAQKEIGERKRAETALQVAQEKLSLHAEALEKQVLQRTAHLHQSVQSLESVCYTIAHDLRAPLRAIRGFTNVILEDYAPSFDETGRQLADRIMSAASRMDALIRDLLEYAKLSHVELPYQTLDLNAIIQKVLEDMAPEISSKQARISVGPLPSIWGNQTIVEQIFTNLLSNALKFVKDDVVPVIEVWAESTESRPKVLIKDNGIGIAADHHERIFEMFQRLHENEKKFPGTGVGLAIVKKGIERIGGRVGLDARTTEGACFYLTFQTSPIL